MSASPPPPDRSRPPTRASERSNATRRAYGDLRQRILDNTMPAGQQYLEQELAEMLGMSRTPVREALIRLAEERLVEVRPRHGARVLPILASDMREIYELLGELEALAARRVAERGLAAAQLAELEHIVAAMDSALQHDDLVAWAAADRTFHERLVVLSGNSRLIGVVQTFTDQVHRARMQTLTQRPKPTASNRDHADVVDAIRCRDGDRAQAIHRRHRAVAGAMLVELIERLGIKQI